jgi:naphthoate synthase
MHQWGLVNSVVPVGDLKAEVRRWADEMLTMSPTALRFCKNSFNADTEHIAGISTLSFSALEVFGHTPEAQEGVAAFVEKRTPQFGEFR